MDSVFDLDFSGHTQYYAVVSKTTGYCYAMSEDFDWIAGWRDRIQETCDEDVKMISFSIISNDVT